MKTIRVVTTVTGLALVWAGVRGIPHSPQPKATPARKASSPAEEIQFAREDQAKQDHEALKNNSATDTEIFAALVRLGQAQDLEARTYGLKQIQSTNALIRQGVAHALGSFDDPLCLAALRKLAKDPVEAVRAQSIASLGRHPAKERAQAIEEILNDAALKAPQRIIALKSLFQAADGPSSPDQKKRAIQGLIEEAKNPSSLELQTEALRAVTAIAPRDHDVLELLHKRLPQEKNPMVAATTILHLGIVGDAWLRENLRTFSRNPDPRVQRSALRVLHLLCPANRWTLLSETLRSNPSPELVLSAIEEALAMPGPRAKTLLEEIVHDQKTPAEALSSAKSALERLPSIQAKDPCESVKK